jgi:butyrate kinase
MCYQISRHIGAQAAVLRGEIDAIVLTGGIAYNEYCVGKIKEMIEFLGKPILVYPGEDELLAMAESVYNVKSGIYDVKVYE